VELWEEGQLCDRVSVRHGLRSIQLDAFGLRWNGQPMRLCAVEWYQPTVEGLAELRSTGVNAIVIPGATKEIWAESERIGLMILARTTEPDMNLVQPSPACLGWVVPGFALKGWVKWKEWSAAVQKVRQLVGAEIIEYTPNWKLPTELRFVIGPDTLPPLPHRPRLMRSHFQQATTDAELGWLDETRSF
jgi:hypothetical protein